MILDTHSCHDLLAKLDELYALIGDRALDDEAVTFRVERAREATILALHFHRTGATTFGLRDEMLTVLTRNAPPSELASNYRSAFTMVYVWFVRDRLLHGWNHTVPRKLDRERGNEADRALVSAAKEMGVPLISYEGYSHDGTIDEGKLVRRHAREEQVTVLLPRQYYAGRVDEPLVVDAFFRKFNREAPAYIEERTKRFGRDGTEDLLKTIHGFYRLILKGEAEGRDDVLTALQKRAGATSAS